MTEKLELRGVSASYRTRAGAVPVLREVSLRIATGESFGLVGESGCGKSTLAMAVVRHLGRSGRVDGGAIMLAGRDLLGMTPAQLRAVRGTEIGMVYQDAMSALNPAIRLGTQLAEGLVVHRGAGWAEARAAAQAMLRRVRLPDPDRMMDAYPHQLSGGQLQRGVIAMALLTRPSLLILDEPTTALDVTVEASIVELIAELQRETRMSLLFISHNLGLVANVCDRIAVMYAGEIVEDGPAADVLRRPAHPYTQGLLSCIPTLQSSKLQARLRPIPGMVTAPRDRPAGCVFGPRCGHFVFGRCDTAPIPLLPAGPDRQARCVRLDEIAHDVTTGDAVLDKPAAADTILAARQLSKQYTVDNRSLAGAILRRPVRHVHANHDLSFETERSTTLAIVGESGCGKTTFARILAGLQTASSGTLLFDGADVAQMDLSRRGAARKRALQMVFQNPDETLNPSFSVGWQIGRAVRKLGHAASVRGRVAELLALTKLPPDISRRKPRQLSGGQKQRVAIARAFAGQPALVVADEPVSALDVSVQASITELLLDIQAEQGTTIVLISHDLGLVRYMADRVVVMYLGRVMESGRTEEVFGPPFHPYTAALIASVPGLDAPRAAPLEGEVPSVLTQPAGCPFASRCPQKIGPICDDERPALRSVNAGGHALACHLVSPTL